MGISRRALGRAAALGTAAVGLQAMTSTAASAASSGTPAAGEQEQLQALYNAAKAEGGRVTVYMGGDAPGFFDFIPQAFVAQFPGIELLLHAFDQLGPDFRRFLRGVGGGGQKLRVL